MNDRNLDRLLEAWMDLGPAVAPDRVADAARLEARTTRQTAIPAGWRPRRFPIMNTTAKIALAAAVAVAAALLGYNYLVAPNIGSPTLFAEPTPTPIPSATPEPATQLVTGSGRLVPGRYEITDVDPFTITITVPAGWESLAIPAMVWSDSDDKATVAFFTVTDVFTDPCDASAGMASMGPTADDLVEALDAAPGVTVDSRADVTVSGYAGTLVEFTTSDPGCGEGNDGLLWTIDPEGQDQSHPGESSLTWYVLDVEGEHLVVDVGAGENTPAADVAEAEAILESIVIEVP